MRHTYLFAGIAALAASNSFAIDIGSNVTNIITNNINNQTAQIANRNNGAGTTGTTGGTGAAANDKPTNAYGNEIKAGNISMPGKIPMTKNAQGIWSPPAGTATSSQLGGASCAPLYSRRIYKGGALENMTCAYDDATMGVVLGPCDEPVQFGIFYGTNSCDYYEGQKKADKDKKGDAEGIVTFKLSPTYVFVNGALCQGNVSKAIELYSEFIPSGSNGPVGEPVVYCNSLFPQESSPEQTITAAAVLTVTSWDDCVLKLDSAKSMATSMKYMVKGQLENLSDVRAACTAAY